MSDENGITFYAKCRRGKIEPINYELKFIIGLMKRFEEFGEYGNPSESEKLFGKPATNIEELNRQQKIRKK